MGCSGGSCSTGCSSCSDGNDGNGDLPPGMLSRYNLNQSVANGALVWVETDASSGEIKAKDSSLNILKAVHDTGVSRLYVAIFGDSRIKKLYPSLFSHGAGTVYHIRGDGSTEYDTEAFSNNLCDVVERISPAIVMMAATERGNEIAECMSSLLNARADLNCDGFRIDDRNLFTEPEKLEQFMASKKYPQIATVKAKRNPDADLYSQEGTAIYWQFKK